MATAGTGGTMATAGTGGMPAATLASITVSPAMPSILKGATQQFTAMGTYSDQSTKDVSGTVTWASDTATTATISAAGLANGVGAGTATISATSGGVTGSTTLSVTLTPPTLVSIAVAPTTASIAVGATQAFTATGTYSDQSTKNLTAMATWTSGTTATATISAAGLATAVAAGTSAISAASGGITGSAALTVTPTAPTLVSIAVTAVASTIAVGTTSQLTATGTYSDSSKKDLSATATWTTATAADVTVSAAGLATGVAGGSSVITATSAGISGTTTITVTAATLMSIAVTPGTPSIATGTTQQFVATGTFKDATTNVTTTQDVSAMATWTSATVATATISTAGLATAKAVGTSIVTATLKGISGTATLTVTMAPLMSIAVSTTTNPASIAKGTTTKFVAIGTFADTTTQDLSTQVTWTSGTPATATISGTAPTIGVATALAVGTTTISAKLTNSAGTVITGTAPLSVTDATLVSIAVTAVLPVNGAPAKIAKGTKVQLIATGTFTDLSHQDLTATATWSSAAVAVATVSSAAGSAGIVTGVAPGPNNVPATSVITAKSGTIMGTLTVTVTGETLNTIVVTPATFTIAAGTKKQYVATGHYTDGSQQFVTDAATWTSGTVATATISNVAGSRGLATGKAMGTSPITAAVGTVTSTNVVTLTVTKAVLMSISITPANPALPLGTTLALKAEGIFSDTTKQDITALVAWSSATPANATISNVAATAGVVTPVKKGTTDITATYTIAAGQTVSTTVTLTVVDGALVSIAITSTKSTAEKGTTVQYTATGTYTAGPTQNITTLVTWKSDKPLVATISNAAPSIGLASAVSTGSAVISATLGAITDTATLLVNDGVLKTIAVTPASPQIAAGTSLQFTAMGTYEDGATQDITDDVTWASDTAVTATVDPNGLVSGVKGGANNTLATAKISATLDAIVGSTTLSVSTATLLSILLDPHPSSTIAKGTTVQFKATGVFSDNSQQDLTDTATWTSSNIATATISNAADSNGLVFGKAAGGPAQITATVGTIVSGMIPLTVTPATLSTIVITTNPASATAAATIAKGVTIDLIATGTYSDQTTQVITGNPTVWASAMATTASVSNAGGQRGHVTGAAVGGPVDITATNGTIVGHFMVTVTAAVPVSIVVTPANSTIAKTHTQQLKAVATMSDGATNVDVTTTATWTSADLAVATVSDVAATKGLATGVAAGGPTAISATVGAVVGKTNLTVTN